MSRVILGILLFLAFVLSACDGGGAGETMSIDLGKGVKLKMVKILAGSFQMGSPDTENNRDRSETLHTVTITKDFYIGKFEVTQAQWQLITGSIPSDFISSDNYPVENVSWDDICKKGGFLDKINALRPGGYSGFRLPTEAEWEYACRAGTTTKYYWGDEINGDYCWYYKNSGGKKHPVGSKKPNAWGLYDMSGNVYEWCDSWYGPYSVNRALVNFTSGRVIRGGSWDRGEKIVRSANRGNYVPSNRADDFGFRLALSSGKD